MAKQSKATIRKRIATRKRNAARRKAMRKTGASPAVAAFDRLDADGASSIDNMRRRLQWLAHIWQIPAEDLPEIKRTPTAELGSFIKKYRVSCDWLLGGDLKGLQRMLGKRKMISAPASPGAARPPAELAVLLRSVVAEEVAKAMAARDRDPA